MPIPAPKTPPIRVLLGATGWPCGLLEVGSWAKRRGLAEVVVFQLQPGAVDEQFLARLIHFRPHVVGFRIELGQFERVKALCAAVRRVCDAEVVLGGPSATSCPCEVLEECGADYVFSGEAEETFARFLELASRQNSRDLLAEIAGLAYRYGGRTCHNTLPADGYQRTPVDEVKKGTGPICLNGPEGASHKLDLSPFSLRCLRAAVRPVANAALIAANRLDWSLLENFTRELDSLYFTGGRGCPGACTFCDRLHGQEFREKGAEQLMEEIASADGMVARGQLKVGRWKLFRYTENEALRDREVGWASIYDEDFFLGRRRAIEFFKLWGCSPLRDRYRINVQTNPCSLLLPSGRIDDELLGWIDRLKPLVQVGAESFHPELLARWRKRHTVGQLSRVIEALDAARQDYSIFVLLTDYETTGEEFIESLRRVVLEGLSHRRMRIASSPYTIPLYDAEVRKRLEFGGRLPPAAVQHFTDYERPHPEWMDPLVARLADLADSELQFALEPEQQKGALLSAMEVVVEELGRRRGERGVEDLFQRASLAMEEVREARFRL